LWQQASPAATGHAEKKKGRHKGALFIALA
jgi:hypothetical protein